MIRGKYRLLRLLGDGGMGSVYEASHELLGTRVAIKVLHADLARRTGLVERFLQEARVAAQIKCPHVVQVTDVDRTPEGVAYIVMELLEGEALSAMLERQGKLAIPAACDFTLQILDALEAAHSLNVVHRDLKPENVFVTYQGAKPVLKLIDFGIAKLRTNAPGEKNLTVAGVLMGTAEYMAPEQAFSADKVDGRSDLYAVGVMLYEMIAGRRPVHGDDGRAIAMKVERGEVVPLVHVAPEVPREIAGLVHRAMAARPELRFASATEMRLALEAALSGQRPPTAALPPAPKHATMQAAPLASAFSPVDAREAAPRTERAPGPIVFQQSTGMAPAVPAPYAPSAASATPSGDRRGGRRGKWPLILGALLLGAGVVVGVLAATGNLGDMSSSSPAATAPPGWASPTPAPPPAATPPPVATPLTGASASAIAPLAPSPPSVGPSPRPGHGPHGPPSAPSASAAPSGGAPSAAPTIPPFTMPSGFPTFPTFPGVPEGGTPLLPFPLPSGFPTTLPSSLPFPNPFPGASPAPSETPAPSKSI